MTEIYCKKQAIKQLNTGMLNQFHLQDEFNTSSIRHYYTALKNLEGQPAPV